MTDKCQGVWSVVIAVDYRRPRKDLNRLSINVPWTPNTQLPGLPVRMRFYLGHKMLWVESKLQHPTNWKTSLLAITNGHHGYLCVCAFCFDFFCVLTIFFLLLVLCFDFWVFDLFGFPLWIFFLFFEGVGRRTWSWVGREGSRRGSGQLRDRSRYIT